MEAVKGSFYAETVKKIAGDLQFTGYVDVDEAISRANGSMEELAQVQRELSGLKVRHTQALESLRAASGDVTSIFRKADIGEESNDDKYDAMITLVEHIEGQVASAESFQDRLDRL